MLRWSICLGLLLLAACADAHMDPAYPPAPTYEAYIRQHYILTEGKILAHFPGRLECQVAAGTEGYTQTEMEVLNAYAQDRHSATTGRLVNIDQARDARIAGTSFLAAHPECADIRAQPGAFTDGRDYVTQAFLNRNTPLFDKHDIDNALRTAAVSCYWDVVQSHLTPADRQALDDYARGGPLPSSLSKTEVKRDEMMLKCPQTMVKLNADLTDYYYSAPGGARYD